ncbi:aldo/keto reductase [Baaleninema sp.]|uniref:aldo/keto reductase n=1 Tax=Baaleninema sp. TaxID=3101197 RepID=UPI003CFCE5BC
MTRDRSTRRKFIATTAAVAGGAIGIKALQKRSPTLSEPASNTPMAMPERVLGRTGESVPIFGLGGAGQTPLSKSGREREALELVETALNLGIRYFDTAASYGPSEDYLGKILPEYRDRIFLASKTAVRDRDGAWRELERSLQRLKTDRLDLWQLHHVSRPEEIDRLFSNTGAIQALEEAKEQGLIRYTGITGHHDPNIIAEGLRRYPFDTTLIPVNAADPHHPQPFLPVVMPVAIEQNVGVIAMKVPAYGKLLESGRLDGMREALGYSLSVPGVRCCVVAAENPQQLADNVRVARQFVPLEEAAMADIERRIASDWEDVTFYQKIWV